MPPRPVCKDLEIFSIILHFVNNTDNAKPDSHRLLWNVKICYVFVLAMIFDFLKNALVFTDNKYEITFHKRWCILDKALLQLPIAILMYGTLNATQQNSNSTFKAVTKHDKVISWKICDWLPHKLSICHIHNNQKTCLNIVQLCLAPIFKQFSSSTILLQWQIILFEITNFKYLFHWSDYVNEKKNIFSWL